MGSVIHLVTVSLMVVVIGVGWRYYQSCTRLPPVVEGFFLPEYRAVAQLFRQYVGDGTEQGASFAVYHHGQPLIDLWGGYADLASRRPWRNDTVTMTWSCAKGATALAVATLVDKGLLDYKAKIHQYWPEFAQNGKDNITVEMLMSHQAGLVTLGGETISLLEYKYDWPKVERVMAAAPPDFAPGTKLVYHAHTFAMYVDALVRRVDPRHRNLSQYFDEEIAKPFAIDFHIGLPLQLFHRAARQHFPFRLQSLTVILRPSWFQFVWKMMTDPNFLVMKAFDVIKFLFHSPEVMNDPRHTEVGVGSMVGFGSAGSLAKMYDALVSQGAAGRKVLVSKSLVDRFSVPITESLPAEFKFEHFVFSQGFQVVKNVMGDVTFGHDGTGGQQARADPKNKLGISYVTNFHWSDSAPCPDHYQRLERVFYECFQRHKTRTAT